MLFRQGERLRMLPLGTGFSKRKLARDKTAM
jgi:hypothetical protein